MQYCKLYSSPAAKLDDHDKKILFVDYLSLGSCHLWDGHHGTNAGMADLHKSKITPISYLFGYLSVVGDTCDKHVPSTSSCIAKHTHYNLDQRLQRVKPLCYSPANLIRGKLSFTGVVSVTLNFHPQGRNVNDVTNEGKS